MHDVVSLQLFSSHLNQSEPHSNQVNRRKIRTPAPNHPTGGCRIDFLVTRSCRQIALGASCDERLWPIEKYSSLADRNETSGPFSFYSAHIHPSTLSPTASISLTYTSCVEKPSCATFPSLARCPPLYKIAFLTNSSFMRNNGVHPIKTIKKWAHHRLMCH